MTDVGLDGDVESSGGGMIIQSPPNVVGQEVHVQISTANRFPRPPIARIIAEATELTTRSAKIADEMVYTLSRRNKDGQSVPIVGPSVRFAEVLAYCYRNLRIQSEFVRIDSSRADRVCVVAMAGIIDLERNTGLSTQSIRSVMTSKRTGQSFMFSADMIAVTTNAAQSIAFRNAVLKLIPKAVWSQVYDAVVATIEGDLKTLPDRRRIMFARFKEVGVEPAQIFAVLGVEKEEHIRLADMPRLAGMFSAIRDGEDPDEVFGRNAPVGAEKPKNGNGNPLADARVATGPEFKEAMERQAAEIYNKDPDAKAANGAPAGTRAQDAGQDAPSDHGPPGEADGPSGPDHEAAEAAANTAAATANEKAAAKADAPPPSTEPQSVEDLIAEIRQIWVLGKLVNWWRAKRVQRENLSEKDLQLLSDVYTQQQIAIKKKTPPKSEDA